MRYLIFFGLIVAGVTCIRYTMWIVKTFGHVAWVERYLGQGSSYTFWRLLGAFLIFGSVIWLRIAGSMGY